MISRFNKEDLFSYLELQADALVIPHGASSQAVINAGVAAMKTPIAGGISVSPGFPLANHVIFTNCCQWQGGKGEEVSV